MDFLKACILTMHKRDRTFGTFHVGSILKKHVVENLSVDQILTLLVTKAKVVELVAPYSAAHIEGKIKEVIQIFTDYCCSNNQPSELLVTRYFDYNILKVNLSELKNVTTPSESQVIEIFLPGSEESHSDVPEVKVEVVEVVEAIAGPSHFKPLEIEVDTTIAAEHIGGQSLCKPSDMEMAMNESADHMAGPDNKRKNESADAPSTSKKVKRDSSELNQLNLLDAKIKHVQKQRELAECSITVCDLKLIILKQKKLAIESMVPNSSL